MSETAASSIWLIRHPEPEVAAGCCYGSLDLELSENGFRQAEALAEAISREPIATVYTSPLRRCRDAAQLLASRRACSCVPLDALREINHGEWEGRLYDEIAAGDPERYRQWMERPLEVCFPGGECFADVRDRVLEAAAMLRARHRGQAIALVSHAGPTRTILADALGIEPRNLFRIRLSYGGVSLIRYWDDVPVVEFVNRAYFPGR